MCLARSRGDSSSILGSRVEGLGCEGFTLEGFYGLEDFRVWGLSTLNPTV